MTIQDLTAATDPAQCECRQSRGDDESLTRWATAGGILSALGICAACCLLPFVLLTLGIAGAWVSALDALARYKMDLHRSDFGVSQLRFLCGLLETEAHMRGRGEVQNVRIESCSSHRSGASYRSRYRRHRFRAS